MEGVYCRMNEQTIVLFDDYGTDSQNLHTSLQLDGYPYPVVVIEENGFLPENVISVYSYYLGDLASAKTAKGSPRYFNQIEVPMYWEINADNRSGKIRDLNRNRGYINYAEPKNKRLVNRVDWLDDKGVIRSSDHYSQIGVLYARTMYDKQGKRAVKTYFSAEGKDAITENFKTGDIILEHQGKTFIFPSKKQFVKKFLEDQGWENCRLLYNSLSTPFFVSELLPDNGKQDILFWQEGERADVPGNMQIIINGEANRTNRIMVQKKLSYDRFVEAGVSTEVIKPLGQIYPFMKTNEYHAHALICTNSDQLEQIETLIRGLPEMTFHIAALTEMSPKLMRLDAYDHVKLYPIAKETLIEKLFAQCDIYLDINHMNEIVSAVSKAFLYNHVVFAFTNTLHNKDYVAPEHVFQPEQVDALVDTLDLMIKDKKKMARCLYQQQRHAMAEKTYEGMI